MLTALTLANQNGCHARPAGQTGYAYRWKQQGEGRRSHMMLAISGKKPGRGLLMTVEEFNPALSMREMTDEWILCGPGGDDLPGPVGLTLADLVA
jgi:hypothetical protein